MFTLFPRFLRVWVGMDRRWFHFRAVRYGKDNTPKATSHIGNGSRDLQYVLSYSVEFWRVFLSSHSSVFLILV